MYFHIILYNAPKLLPILNLCTQCLQQHYQRFCFLEFNLINFFCLFFICLFLVFLFLFLEYKIFDLISKSLMITKFENMHSSDHCHRKHNFIINISPSKILLFNFSVWNSCCIKHIYRIRNKFEQLTSSSPRSFIFFDEPIFVYR